MAQGHLEDLFEASHDNAADLRMLCIGSLSEILRISHGFENKTIDVKKRTTASESNGVAYQREYQRCQCAERNISFTWSGRWFWIAYRHWWTWTFATFVGAIWWRAIDNSIVFEISRNAWIVILWNAVDLIFSIITGCKEKARFSSIFQITHQVHVHGTFRRGYKGRWTKGSWCFPMVLPRRILNISTQFLSDLTK